jgi:hypothetical protein
MQEQNFISDFEWASHPVIEEAKRNGLFEEALDDFDDLFERID